MFLGNEGKTYNIYTQKFNWVAHIEIALFNLKIEHPLQDIAFFGNCRTW